MSVSRREFLSTTAAAAVAAALPPWAARAAALTGCDYVIDIAKHWNLVRPMLASRYHRLHHVLFHYVRNNWAGFDAKKQEAIAALDWNTPRPSLEKAAWDHRAGRAALYWATDNASGEDFLFFHRWMIAMVDAELAKHGKGPIEPWSDKDVIPAPGGECEDEKVPEFTPLFEDPKNPNKPIAVPSLQRRVHQLKTDAFYWDKLNWWQHEYRDRAALATTTLGAFGARLELGVHNQMHIRWSAYPSNGWLVIRDEADFRTKWDNGGYDTLFDEYSSHVTPIFFRLHKWIDNRIEDWAEAHKGDVERYKTPYGFDWFRTGKWVAIDKPWTGAWGFEPVDSGEERRRIGVMERVTRAMFPPEATHLKQLAKPREREEMEEKFITIRDLIM